MDEYARIRKSRPVQDAAAAAVRESLDEWVEAVNRHSVDETTALYAPDAVLLGTFAAAVLTTPAGRKDYFTSFLARKNLEAAIGECHIEALGDDAGMANGLYTFSFIDDAGTAQTVQARFTFVYARQPEGDWLIQAHHSSILPPS